MSLCLIYPTVQGGITPVWLSFPGLHAKSLPWSPGSDSQTVYQSKFLIPEPASCGVDVCVCVCLSLSLSLPPSLFLSLCFSLSSLSVCLSVCVFRMVARAADVTGGGGLVSDLRVLSLLIRIAGSSASFGLASACDAIGIAQVRFDLI